MSYIGKSEHIHEHTNADPCNDSYKILHRNLGKEMNAQKTPGVFIMFSTKYDSIHANKCFEVEHGRNHLITCQWWKPLTSARDTTINVKDSQGVEIL